MTSSSADRHKIIMQDLLKFQINTIEQRLRSLLVSESSGHDFEHVDRVRRTALEIAAVEGGNLCIIEMIALLHDVGDWKFHDRGLNGQSEILKEFLSEFDLPGDLRTRLIEEIPRIGFKGSRVTEEGLSLEARIVRDADRLDAIGAIGIARCFAYGGHKGLPIFDADIPVEQHADALQYHHGKPPSVHHFYEKLLLLKDRMHTLTAKKLALERHEFLVKFLEQFFREWFGRVTIPKQFCLKDRDSEAN